MANIIIPKGDSLGKTRSEQEKNLRKEWGPTMSDEQLSKLEFLERKAKEATGSTKNFISQADLEAVK